MASVLPRSHVEGDAIAPHLGFIEEVRSSHQDAVPPNLELGERHNRERAGKHGAILSGDAVDFAINGGKLSVNTGVASMS